VAKQLINVAVKRFKLDKDMLINKNNKRVYVYSRTAIVMVLYEKFPECRYKTIAWEFNRKSCFVNHCQVRHDDIKHFRDYDEIYQLFKNYL